VTAPIFVKKLINRNIALPREQNANHQHMTLKYYDETQHLIPTWHMLKH